MRPSRTERESRGKVCPLNFQSPSTFFSNSLFVCLKGESDVQEHPIQRQVSEDLVLPLLTILYSIHKLTMEKDIKQCEGDLKEPMKCVLRFDLLMVLVLKWRTGQKSVVAGSWTCWYKTTKNPRRKRVSHPWSSQSALESNFFLLLFKSSPRRDACESVPVPGSQSWIPLIATPISPNHSLSIPKLLSRTTWPSAFFRCIFVSLFVPAWRKIWSSRSSYINAFTPPKQSHSS